MWWGFEEERGTSRYILQCVCVCVSKRGCLKSLTVVVFVSIQTFCLLLGFTKRQKRLLHTWMKSLTWKSVAEGSSRMVFGGVMTEGKFWEKRGHGAYQVKFKHIWTHAANDYKHAVTLQFVSFFIYTTFYAFEEMTHNSCGSNISQPESQQVSCGVYLTWHHLTDDVQYIWTEWIHRESYGWFWWWKIKRHLHR